MKMNGNHLLCEVYYSNFPDIFLDLGKHSLNDGCVYTCEDAR